VLIVALTASILQNKNNSFNFQILASFSIILITNYGGIVSQELLAANFLTVHAVINILFITLIYTKYKVRLT